MQLKQVADVCSSSARVYIVGCLDAIACFEFYLHFPIVQQFTSLQMRGI